MKRSIALLATLSPLFVTHCTRPETSSAPVPGDTALPASLATKQKLAIPTENVGVTVRAFGRAFRGQFGSEARVTAEARIPQSASDAFTLTRNDARLSVTPVGAAATQGTVENGIVHYRGAFGANTEMLQKLTPHGTEDYVRFESQPARESLSYRVDLDQAVVSVRHFGGVIEFLDKDGTPVFRMNTPYGIDAEGKAFAVSVKVNGCAVDSDPRGPWGRELPRAGADHCMVDLGWSGVSYPAAIDPAWTSAGVMAASNVVGETGTVLSGGKVLAVHTLYPESPNPGGANPELFDPTTNTWAVTGKPTNAINYWAQVASLNNNKALLTTGRLYNAPYTYDLGTGVWTAAAALPASLQSNEATALFRTGGDKVLLIADNGAVEEYNGANNTYTSKSAAIGGFTFGGHKAAFQISATTIIVTGGNSGNQHRVYDFANFAWSATVPVTSLGNSYGTSFTPLGNGKVLVYTGDTRYASLWDVANNTRTAVTVPGTIPSVYYIGTQTAAFPIGGGKWLVAAGRGTFDENTNAITDNGVFASAATQHGMMVKLQDARLLAFNGGGTWWYGGNSGVTSDLYGPNAQADCNLPSAFAVAATPVFDSTKKLCAACDGDNSGATALKCPDGAKPACQAGAGNPLLGTCTVCSGTNETLCTGTTPRCDTAVGTCAGCNGGLGVAGATRACKGATAPVCKNDGSCIAANADFGFAGATAACPTSANPYQKADGSCGKCTTNADCTGATHTGPICNATTGACGTTCATNADCTATQFCDATGKTCVAKRDAGGSCTAANQCLSNSCSSGKCDKACTTNADCTASQFCDTAGTPKVCKNKSSDGAACTAAEQCASGKCTNGKCGGTATTDAGSSGSTSGGPGDAGTSGSNGEEGGSGGCSTSGRGTNDGAATGAGVLVAFGAMIAGLRRKRDRKGTNE
ncbi:MAG: dickkopf-related protein [Polyangiaceae bacterium]